MRFLFKKCVPSSSSSSDQTGLINRHLSRSFYILGEKVSQNSKQFITISVLVSLVLGTGLFRVVKFYRNEVDYLYTPTNGESIIEQKTLDELFPSNYSDQFSPSRPNKIGRFARVIIEAKDGGSILRSTIFQEILKIDNILKNATIKWGKKTLNYSQLCAKWLNDCFENDVLELGDLMDKIENRTIHISYPQMFNVRTFKLYTLPLFFGGEQLDEDGLSMIGAKSLLLNYILAVDNQDDDSRGFLWEETVAGILDKVEWNHIKPYYITFAAYSKEQEKMLFSVIPYFLITIFIMGNFVCASTMMRDTVKSKPLLGFMSMISATLGTLAGFGLVLYCRVEFIGLNLAIPFIMLGIGIDDAFVMIAAWRRTNPKDAVPKRLAETYSDAAVSITITSLTDALSFYVGLLTPIPSVQIFSAYAGTCVLAIFAWNIFFFGPLMAISGLAEAQNKSGLLWWMVATPKSKTVSTPDNYSNFHKFFLTGGTDPLDPDNILNLGEQWIMKYFRDKIAPFLFKLPVQLSLFGVFLLYIGISAFGIMQLDEGLRVERLVRYDSFLYDYIIKENQYFRLYPYRVQVMVTNKLDYSNNETQANITEMMDEFKSSRYVYKDYTENWLDDFLGFIERRKAFDSEEEEEYNVETEQDFIETLREKYLSPFNVNSRDIKFGSGENGSEIIASRFIVQSYNLTTALEERDGIVALREIAAKQASRGFEVKIYHPWTRFADQFIMIRGLAIQLMIIAAVIVMIISVIFIPNFLCALCVLFTIISIEIGVLGFMSLWSVSLDLISIINLLMCIGFSVDFSAHVAYSFITCPVPKLSTGDSGEFNESQERVRMALYSLGLPIVQGAISTLIGIFALVFIPAYVFSTFAKIVFLVIVFASLHGLVFLPILLSLVSRNSNNSKRDQNTKASNSNNLEIPISNKIGEIEESKIEEIEESNIEDFNPNEIENDNNKNSSSSQVVPDK